MSHCEWKPISETVKFSDPVYVWSQGSLTEAVWHRDGKDTEFAWMEAEYIPNWGMGYSLLNPQPKYYLAVTPPPEG